MLKNQINKKFENISHKWFSIDIDSEDFKDIKQKIINFVNEHYELKQEIKVLINQFKLHEFVWIKYLKTQGKENNEICKCLIITHNENKIEIDLNPKIVLNSKILNGTPKSLSLFNETINKKQDKWKKPNDGFNDEFETKIDDELTEAGYICYKDFIDELKINNLSLEQWHKKRGGPNWEKFPNHLKDLIN